MANEEHLAIVRQGRKAIERWKALHKFSKFFDLSNADLSGIDLTDADLQEADLTAADLREARLHNAYLLGANLSHADLSGAFLSGANLSGVKLNMANLSRTSLPNTRLREATMIGGTLANANLSHAFLRRVHFEGVDLTGADLHEADLTQATLFKTNLSGANLMSAFLPRARFEYSDLTEANLSYSTLTQTMLIQTNLAGANLTGAKLVMTIMQNSDLSGCRVYGVSVWDVFFFETIQHDLIITHAGLPDVKVDDIRVAQFIYLLLNNENIRSVIDTIGEKGVLILGRFGESRKKVLDAIRTRLREIGFVPIMFDFKKPNKQDFTGTIKILAGLSRFIIADITNPKSSPLELQATMPDYMVPFVPIIQEDEEPFAMFQDLKQKYGDWVLDVLKYDSTDGLIKVFEKAIVTPALKMADRLLLKKTEKVRTRHTRDYL